MHNKSAKNFANHLIILPLQVDMHVLPVHAGMLCWVQATG